MSDKSPEVKPLALFPTYIWVSEVSEQELGMTHAEMSRLIDRGIQPRPKLQHGRSWQTEQNLHRLAPFSRLVELFIRSSEQVLQAQKIQHSGIEVTGCWANVSPPGSLHTPHMHPNNVLSGVYYPRVQEGANTIAFHSDARSNRVISPAVGGLNEFNAAEVAVALQTGSLVVFPSTLTHSVPPNQSSQERISVSFNIMFKDFSRTISPPKWQGIPFNQA